MIPWEAFRWGLRLAARRWQALLAAFLSALLSAVVAALLPGRYLWRFAATPAIADLAEGLDISYVVDAIAGITALDSPGGLDELILPLFLGVVIALGLSWFVGAFLYGGVLLAYRDVPDPFSWRRFLWGCWHWWGPFLLLGVLAVMIFTLLILPVLVGLAVLAGRVAWLAWVVAVLAGLLLAFWLAWFEVAHVVAVAEGRRNVFWALWRALVMLVRRPLPWMGFYLLALLLLGGIHLVFRAGVLPVISFEFWPLALVGTQVFVLLRLWARLGRLAGGMYAVKGC